MEYHITQVEAHADTGVVHTSHWTLHHQDGQHTAYRYGSVFFPTDPAETPTQFNALTEAQVLAWTQAVLGEEYMASLEASCLAEIEEKKNPTNLKGAPWAVVPTLPAGPVVDPVPDPNAPVMENTLPGDLLGKSTPASEVERLLAEANRKNDEATSKYRR